MENQELNEQELGRRASLQALLDLGINPYPAELYPVNTNSAEIRKGFDPEKNNYQDVCIAGRIMGRRIMTDSSTMPGWQSPLPRLASKTEGRSSTG